jgi:hypothetical protein
MKNHSDFNFRNPLTTSKDKHLSESLARINKIASGNFSPIQKINEENIASKIINKIVNEEEGVLPWLTKATLVITTLAGLFAGLGTLYTALKDWFSGKREFRHETQKIKRDKETDKGAKEFFEWLPKSRTFSQMQKIMRELQSSGGYGVSQKNEQITKMFIEEVKQSKLSPLAILYIAKELNIKPQYLQSGVAYTSPSAVLSGAAAASQNNMGMGMEQKETKGETNINEVSPPSGPARRFTKKPEVKAAFKKRYGDRWKEVMYATGWKMHNK